MSDFNLASELERLASAGYAPCVLYDDNGNWAISDEGSYTLRIDDSEDFQASIFGEAAWFRPTVKEAWEVYLKRLRESGNEV